MMGTIWFDVTSMLAWSRPAVGVIRVESEVVRHLLDVDEPNVQFCRFDKEHSTYRKVQPASIRAALKKLDADVEVTVSSAIATGPSAGAVHPVTAEDRFRAFVFSTINKLPGAIRELTLNFVIRRGEAYSAARAAWHEAKRSMSLLIRPSATPSSPPLAMVDSNGRKREGGSIFGPSDVYVSLGLDWAHKDFSYLYSQKRKFGFKAVLFCYDLIPIKLPHLCVGDVAPVFAKYFADLGWSADTILCISECSRRDLSMFLESIGAPLPPTSVIRLGCDLPASEGVAPAPEVMEVAKQRYILFVSTIERRKNHETLYRAYTRLVDGGRRNLPLLVFVGMPGWGVADLMEDLRLDRRIRPYLRILNHVSDSDLSYLYKCAYFTVYPSLYEGWGLPVAESLAHGKFCLASDTASIPEVGGNLIEYLDPWDIPQWTKRLAWYFDHPDELAKREAIIRAGFSPAGWSATGAGVLANARSLLSAEEL